LQEIPQGEEGGNSFSVGNGCENAPGEGCAATEKSMEKQEKIVYYDDSVEMYQV